MNAKIESWQCITRLVLWQVGLNLDRRSALQVPCQPYVVAKPAASSSQLPPLPATKSGKNSASHGQLPRPGLRSRASIEKNLNVISTGAQRGSSESLQSGLPLLPLWNKRTSSLPVRTNVLTSGIDPDSNKGHIHDLGHTLHSEVSSYSRLDVCQPGIVITWRGDISSWIRSQGCSLLLEHFNMWSVSAPAFEPDKQILTPLIWCCSQEMGKWISFDHSPRLCLWTKSRVFAGMAWNARATCCWDPPALGFSLLGRKIPLMPLTSTYQHYGMLKKARTFMFANFTRRGSLFILLECSSSSLNLMHKHVIGLL